MARHDKSWKDAMSVNDLEVIKRESAGKLFKLRPESDLQDDEEPKKKKRRIVLSTQRAGPEVKYLTRPKEVLAEELTSDNLKGKVVVVEPGPNKEKLELIVLSHGGKIEQNVKAGVTYCFIQTQGKFKAKSVVRSEKFDVVKAEWLLDCESQFRPFQPWDMIFARQETLDEFTTRDLDEFSDPFSEDSTKGSLKYSMEKTVELNALEIPVDEVAMANLEYEMTNYKMGLFRTMAVYLDNPLKDEFNPLNLVGLLIEFYGGQIIDDLDDDHLTHVVLDQEDLSRLTEIKKVRRLRDQGKKFRILTSDYFEECSNCCKLLNPEDYEL